MLDDMRLLVRKWSDEAEPDEHESAVVMANVLGKGSRSRAGGDYDWAQQAMDYWPDRFREKCKTNKSFAIAHGLA